MVAPQFPMVPADIPENIRMTVDDWVGVVDRAIRAGRRRSRCAGQRFRWRPAAAPGHARCSRSAHDHGSHAASRIFRRADPQVSGRQSAAGIPADHREEMTVNRSGERAGLASATWIICRSSTGKTGLGRCEIPNSRQRRAPEVRSRGLSSITTLVRPA